MGGLGVSALAGFEVPRVRTLLYVDTHLFLCIIPIVVVVVNNLEAVYTCLAPLKGNHDGAVVSGFFIAPTRDRPVVGDPYGRAGGYGTTVGKR
jgi:hypothetical protein